MGLWFSTGLVRIALGYASRISQRRTQRQPRSFPLFFDDAYEFFKSAVDAYRLNR